MFCAVSARDVKKGGAQNVALQTLECGQCGAVGANPTQTRQYSDGEMKKLTSQECICAMI